MKSYYLTLIQFSASFILNTGPLPLLLLLLLANHLQLALNPETQCGHREMILLGLLLLRIILLLLFATLRVSHLRLAETSTTLLAREIIPID